MRSTRSCAVTRQAIGTRRNEKHYHASVMIPLIMRSEVKPSSSELLETQVLQHLDCILTSHSFATSPRCCEFLRFVVQETLTGRSDTIKERTIAMEVFGKDASFEPGEDSVVRVKARDIRKRLAEFYEHYPDSAIRINLPLGGYIPTFEETPPQAAPEEVPAFTNPEPARKPLQRRSVLFGGLAACAAAAWPIFRYTHARATPLDQLWQPVFSTRNPLLISIPLLRDKEGSVTERVGLGAATAANETAEFLGSHHYPYHVRFGSELTYSQLREQPSLLLGGFSSTWTTRITSNLRFTMIPIGFVDGGAIRDNQTGKTYGPINNQIGQATEDYAMVCRLFDAPSGQIIMIAAGITTFGTESAGRFLLRPQSFARIIDGQSSDWQKKNFQAIIHLSIIDKTPSAPTLVASHFWS